MWELSDVWAARRVLEFPVEMRISERGVRPLEWHVHKYSGPFLFKWWWFEKRCWDDNLSFFFCWPSYRRSSSPSSPEQTRLFFRERWGAEAHEQSFLSKWDWKAQWQILGHLIVRGVHFVSVPTLLQTLICSSGERGGILGQCPAPLIWCINHATMSQDCLFQEKEQLIQEAGKV